MESRRRVIRTDSHDLGVQSFGLSQLVGFGFSSFMLKVGPKKLALPGFTTECGTWPVSRWPADRSHTGVGCFFSICLALLYAKLNDFRLGSLG